MKKLLLLSILSISFFGCGEDEEDEARGNPIGAPQVKPPVERNTPSGLASVNLRLLEEGESANNTPEKRIVFEVARYLNPAENQATTAPERLDAIDERMAELDRRAQDSTPRLCLATDLEDHTLAASLPNSDTFAMQFQCQENLDNGSGEAESAQLAFGVSPDTFYLMERTGNADNAVLASADLSETWTEFWQLGISQGGTHAGSESFIHLRAEDGVGMEITTAGSGYSVFDCGLQMKANDTYVYIEAYDFLSEGSDAQCATEQTVMCLTAADMVETDVSNCTGAELDTFSLTALSRDGVVADSADTIIHTPITGYIDFTEEAEVPDESSE